MNTDPVHKNEILSKNENLATANSSLAKQIDEVQVKARVDKEKHLVRRRKLQSKLQALEELGPPLTEELRQQIQADYRKSDELNEEIVHMYSEVMRSAEAEAKQS